MNFMSIDLLAQIALTSINIFVRINVKGRKKEVPVWQY